MRSQSVLHMSLLLHSHFFALKKTLIRSIAVRKISGIMGALFRVLLKPPYITSLSYWGVWGEPLIGASLHPDDSQYPLKYICRYIYIYIYRERNLLLILVKSANMRKIVFTIFWLIWSQMDFCLVQNRSEHNKYNLN